MSLRAVDVEFTDVGPAISQLGYDRCDVVFATGVGAGERMRQTLEMSLPASDFKVEVVLVSPGRFAKEFP